MYIHCRRSHAVAERHRPYDFARQAAVLSVQSHLVALHPTCPAYPRDLSASVTRNLEPWCHRGPPTRSKRSRTLWPRIWQISSGLNSSFCLAFLSVHELPTCFSIRSILALFFSAVNLSFPEFRLVLTLAKPANQPHNRWHPSSHTFSPALPAQTKPSPPSPSALKNGTFYLRTSST